MKAARMATGLEPGAPPGTAAIVAGEPLLVAEVEQRLAELRRGPFATRLPAPDTAEGRNMRRWVVQLCAAERLVHRECHRRGIATGTAATGRTRLDLGFALAAGGVAAAVLVRTAGASVLADQLAETELVCDVDVRAYYDRNLDEFSDGARSFAEARSDIRTELRAAARRRAFTRWLDQAQREVTLLPGYEHPAEPGHADATHRH